VRHSKVARPCPSWVKLRRTQCEHMFSALPLNADIPTSGRHPKPFTRADIERARTKAWPSVMDTESWVPDPDVNRRQLPANC
jgi:hypothetical protein